MVQISLQTREERVKMYKKVPKLQLIEMLVNCNLQLEELTKQLHKPDVSGSVCSCEHPDEALIRDGEKDFCLACNQQTDR